MKEQWKQQMRQKMADYRKAAPEVSWDKLDEALASNKPKAKAPIKREKNDACISSSEREVVRQKIKAVPMWMRRIAAAVVVLVVATAGYLALNRNHEELSRGDGFDHSVSSANGIMQNRPHHETSRQAEPVISQKTDRPTPAPLLAVATPRQQNRQNEEPAVAPQAVQTAGPQEEASASQPQESQPQKVHDSQESHRTQTVVETPKRQTMDYPSEVRPQTTANSRLTAKVYLSNGLAGSDTRIEAYDDLKAEMGEYGTPGSTSTTKSQYYTQNYLGMLTEQHHHQPVRLGLFLRYRLNNKWSVESGVAYTRLRSDLKWSSGANTEQALSYVGIPVNVNYLLWSSRYVNFYISAGGMVEKMVEGKQETNYHGSIKKEYVSIHPLQFSINSGIGAEFNLTNQFSIYAEPGMGYYFDNGSDVPTFYQDKPFNFNLNLGLRFSFEKMYNKR